jgi:putative ABC transport system substrate-binding protein
MLAGGGESYEDHLNNVTGVSSRGPIRKSLEFIHEILPDAKRVGTLWTPSEINSEYYLELAREAAIELGMEMIAVPVENSSEVLLSAQVLMNKKIDVIYQISDNTINASFEALGKVAEEHEIPLFGGYPQHTRLGAAAAMGWDFFNMGYKAGLIALRVKSGESPARIPIQSMEKVILHINLDAAQKQRIRFSEETLAKADTIIGVSGNPTGSVWIP